MSTAKEKDRVNYTLKPAYSGGWEVTIYTAQKFKSAAEGLEAIRSMYLLEDPDEVEASIEVKGNVALDRLFKLTEE
jgi:hypothetical protein